MPTTLDLPTVKQVIESALPADPQCDIVIRFDDDWIGAPSIYVWIIVADDTDEAFWKGQQPTDIDWAIARALDARGDERMVYTAFRTPSEQDQVEGGDVEDLTVSDWRAAQEAHDDAQ